MLISMVYREGTSPATALHAATLNSLHSPSIQRKQPAPVSNVVDFDDFGLETMVNHGVYHRVQSFVKNMLLLFSVWNCLSNSKVCEGDINFDAAGRSSKCFCGALRGKKKHHFSA